MAPDRVRTPRPRALTASDLVRAPDGAVHLTPVATAARLTPVGTAVRLTPVATDGAKSRRGVLTLAARARAANQVEASSSGGPTSTGAPGGTRATVPEGSRGRSGRGSTSASRYEGDSSRGFPRQAGRGSTSGSRYAGSRYAGGRGDADRETGRQGTSTRRNTGEAPALGGRARDGRAVSRGGYGPDRGVRDGGRDFGRDAGNNAWRPAPRRTVPKGWGSVTRHGVRELDYDGGSASAIWSRTQERARAESGRPSSVTAPKPVVRDSFTYEPSSPSDSGGWAATLVETVPASSSPRRSSKSPGPKARATKDREAPRKRVSASRPAFPQQSGKGEGLDHKVGALLGDATRAYSADRYQDALRILRRLSTQAPTSAPVKELLGLTLYRLGKWPLAVRELQAHHELSGSYDQFPVIADCHRATRRYAEADAVWAELRKASPSAEVIAEGRMVAAGCLADQGDLKGAVELLEGFSQALQTQTAAPATVVRPGRPLRTRR